MMKMKIFGNIIRAVARSRKPAVNWAVTVE